MLKINHIQKLNVLCIYVNICSLKKESYDITKYTKTVQD